MEEDTISQDIKLLITSEASSLCALLGPYQLLGHLLHQCSKVDVIALPIVVHVLHQLGDGFCVSFRLKLVAFAFLHIGSETKLVLLPAGVL